ncbi:unnamed protein product [Rotaria sp. Silwood2]|nr:unnamed protein product [Rotaria sp. Silwood2]
MVDSLISDDNDQHLAATLVAYRHRFQQSKTYKALQWSQKSQIEPPVCELCDMAVPLNVVIEVLTKSRLTNKQLCAITFGCEKQSDFPVFSWNVTFPDKPKPPPRPPQPPAPGSPKLSVLHLSDIHVDFGYKPGSMVACLAPLCCRDGQPVLADSWIKLGLPVDTRDSILRGAFYTTIIRPGLRLVSLNMNYCPKENYWLYINSTDPLDQLQWLIHWLQYAEDHNEKVHIIGHHPPQDCLVAFSWNFHKIINRYENTIAGQFYGHRHNDEFAVVYDEVDPKRPVSMMYIGPSLTTESFLNPGYRVFSIDGDYSGSSYWVLDHRTVIMNLTASNIYNQTIFVDEYSARGAYQMENLFPADWNDVAISFFVILDILQSIFHIDCTRNEIARIRC